MKRRPDIEEAMKTGESVFFQGQWRTPEGIRRLRERDAERQRRKRAEQKVEQA